MLKLSSTLVNGQRNKYNPMANNNARSDLATSSSRLKYFILNRFFRNFLQAMVLTGSLSIVREKTLVSLQLSSISVHLNLKICDDDASYVHLVDTNVLLWVYQHSGGQPREKKKQLTNVLLLLAAQNGHQQ